MCIIVAIILCILTEETVNPIVIRMMPNARKGSLCNFRTTQAQISLQGLCCSLTESMFTVVYVDEQRMLRSDCTYAHADLDLSYPQICKGLFHALCIICKYLICIYPVTIYHHLHSFIYIISSDCSISANLHGK